MFELTALEDRIKFFFPKQCTIYQEKEIQEGLLEVFSELSSETEVDLSLVREFDSGGVQLLLMLKNSLEKEDRNIRFTNPSLKVVDILEAYNLLDLIKEN